MAKQSRLERLFQEQLGQAGLPAPTCEYRFHPTRKWRFDFAWCEYKVAVEVEGGVWSRGRHVRGQGFIDDCEKYNAAAALGWRVFRFPGSQVEDGTALEWVQEVLRCCASTS